MAVTGCESKHARSGRSGGAPSYAWVIWESAPLQLQVAAGTAHPRPWTSSCNAPSPKKQQDSQRSK